MAKDRKGLVYLAHADRVVKTDDVEYALGDSAKDVGFVYAYNVATTRERMYFINVIDDGVVVNRWDASVTPMGTLELKFWRDTSNRETDDPEHILILASGAWWSVEANVELVVDYEAEVS